MTRILTIILVWISVNALAAETPNRNRMPVGTGPFSAKIMTDPTLPNHVIYRPENLEEIEDHAMPIVIWGNGGCTDDGASAMYHLMELASHGYLVIAPGRILSDPEATSDFRLGPEHYMTTDDKDMLDGLEWATAQNSAPESVYFGKLMPEAVGVSGHSCGGILSIKIASSDLRIKAVVIHNSGVFPNRPDRPTLITDKRWLKGLKTPMLYLVGNDTDVGTPVALDDFARIDHVPVFLGSLNVGHQGTFSEPNGGVAAFAARQWFDWQLKGDVDAATNFIGAECGLCLNPEWKVKRKNFDLLKF